MRSTGSTVSWPRRRSGCCGRARSCGRSTATAPPGGTASWWRSGFVAATWPAPRRRSPRPWPSATTASRGGAACCWRKATRRAAVRSLTRALADPGFLARERRVFVLPVHVDRVPGGGRRAGGQRERRRAGGAGATVRHARTGRGRRGGAWRAGAPPRRHRRRRSPALQEGVRTWCEVDAPYEAAEARVLLARALAADGDDAGARLEIKAAARSAEEFGAAVDLDIAPAANRARRASASAPSSSPTSWTRPGWPRRWATTPGSSCCAGTTAPCAPSSRAGGARR